ncbi:MAG: SPOR domain-containing protein [Perlucidibaca sp.]
MDIAVKQRILGGVVLVAGAILFLPMLLEGAGVTALQPPAPPAPPVTPTTRQLAPALQQEAHALEQGISASHGEPTFYPVQPPQVAESAPTPAVEEQFRMVEPAAAPAAPVSKPAAVVASPERKPAEDTAAAAAAQKQLAERKAAEQAKADKAAADAKAAKLAAEKQAAAKAAAEKAAAEKAATAKAKAAASEKPAATSAPDPALPQAWVVQVASLSSRDKAQALVDKLRAKGYRAALGGAEGAWRVSIGPELDRSVAQSIKSRVAADASLKLSGWIQPYRP